jgi:hypothetical protein
MALTAIELNFYNDEDEIIETYTRIRVPSYLLDMALDLEKDMGDMDDGRPGSEKTAPLFDFVVEFYGNKFSRDKLKMHTDLGECMSIYQATLGRAYSLMSQQKTADPTLPSRKRKKKR